jgi:hypothetical protein
MMGAAGAVVLLLAAGCQAAASLPARSESPPALMVPAAAVSVTARARPRDHPMRRVFVRANSADQEANYVPFFGQRLMLVGALHTLFGVVMHFGPLTDIARDRVFDAVGPHPDRQATLRFLVGGVSLLLMRYLTRWTQHQTGTLPTALADASNR